MSTAVARPEPSAFPAGAPTEAALQVTCWGTRGSIPSPGADTVRFGGNTPCVEVRCGEGPGLLLDAGTGIRCVGESLAGAAAPELDLFLTHYHWDHIQGLPFFAPLYRSGTRLRVHAPPRAGRDAQTLFAGQMSGEYFPVPFSVIAAGIEFTEVGDDPCVVSGMRVGSFAVCHPGGARGFRIDSDRGSLAYVPDNELYGEAEGFGPAWRASLAAALQGVDLLIHDAMYTNEEYARHRGWGHSTYDQAVELAEAAGVPRLAFFHHAPARSDAALETILEGVRSEIARRGSGLAVEMAAENRSLEVERKGP